MFRFGQLRLAYVAIACALWVLFVVALPRLLLLTTVGVSRVRARLSPTTDYAIAFGTAHWTSQRVMFLVAALPPVALLVAWTVARLTDHETAP